MLRIAKVFSEGEMLQKEFHLTVRSAIQTMQSLSRFGVPLEALLSRSQVRILAYCPSFASLFTSSKAAVLEQLRLGFQQLLLCGLKLDVLACFGTEDRR